jgi:hypothetical protein
MRIKLLFPTVALCALPVACGGRALSAPADASICGGGDDGGCVTAAPDGTPNETSGASCAELAQALCARITACPLHPGEAQSCMVVEPETVCVTSMADCVGFFSACTPTSSPPSNELTIVPDPAACNAAIAGATCMKQGADQNFYPPTSCIVCPPPWTGMMGSGFCTPHLPDGG